MTLSPQRLEARRRRRSIPCAYCDAPAGEPCRTSSGKRAVEDHEPRRRYRSRTV